MSWHTFRHLFVLLLFTCTLALAQEKRVWGRLPVHHVNGSYEGLIVAIHDDVGYEPDLITDIQEVIRTASDHLRTATNKTFGKITILLPVTWNRPELALSGLSVKVATQDQTFDNSHIRIRDVADDEPFVLQPGRCGDEGVFIGVTRSYINSDSNNLWGDPGKGLVHLWGHFRWGLFDEYAHFLEEQAESLIRCNDQIYVKCQEFHTGIEDVPAYFESKNNFIECNDPTNNETHHINTLMGSSSGSIMSVPDMSEITEFCHSSKDKPDSSRHNNVANNPQNRKCSNQSAWEVMDMHPDFINASSSGDTFTETSFDLVIIRRWIVVFIANEMKCTYSSSSSKEECYMLWSTILSKPDHIFKIKPQDIYCTFKSYALGSCDEEIDYDGQIDENESSELLVFESGIDIFKNESFLADRTPKRIQFVTNDNTTLKHEICMSKHITCESIIPFDYMNNIHYEGSPNFIQIYRIERETQNDTTIEIPELDTYTKSSTTGLILRLTEVTGLLTLEESERDDVAWYQSNSSDNSKTMTEVRAKGGEKAMINGFHFNVARNADAFYVTYIVQWIVLKKKKTKNSTGAVEIYPYLLKSSVDLSNEENITMYGAVSQNDKLITGAYVTAEVRRPDYTTINVALKETEADMDKDGIYSGTFTSFNGDGVYFVVVRVTGKTNETKWDKYGLQANGLLSTNTLYDISRIKYITSVPEVLPLADRLRRASRQISFHVINSGGIPKVSTTITQTTFPISTNSKTTDVVTSSMEPTPGYSTLLSSEITTSSRVDITSELKLDEYRFKTTVIDGVLNETTFQGSTQPFSNTDATATLITTTLVTTVTSETVDEDKHPVVILIIVISTVTLASIISIYIFYIIIRMLSRKRGLYPLSFIELMIFGKRVGKNNTFETNC